jgi:hypothetical protein
MSDFKPYLHSAHIEGYKSIVNCDVTFKPGLNIIIGKNGTGKTNLLEAIDISMDLSSAPPWEREPGFESKLIFEMQLDPPKTSEISIQKLSFSNEGTDNSQNENLNRFKFRFEPRGTLAFGAYMFHHSTPKSIPFLTNFEAGWSFKKGGISYKNQEESELYALKALSRTIYRQWMDLNLKSVDSTSIKNIILKSFEDFKTKILPWIKAYTPITDLKIQEGWIDPGIINETYEAKGFRFLFEINGSFHPFQNLSDGTKRIVLLTMELCELPTNQYAENTILHLYLLEEPELGIHPHQLHLLMNFIKDQTKEKQIIITTHSPQVMDILTEEELDRIIIADFDPEKGSTFRHLDEEETKKARFIMQEEPLSHYWRYSDLEHSPMF